jgi:hypothetical protein
MRRELQNSLVALLLDAVVDPFFEYERGQKESSLNIRDRLLLLIDKKEPQGVSPGVFL